MEIYQAAEKQVQATKLALQTIHLSFCKTILMELRIFTKL